MIVAIVVVQLVALAWAVRADFARWHRGQDFASIVVRPADDDAVDVDLVRVVRHNVRRLDPDD